MDNVTHTLAGLLVAQAVIHLREVNGAPPSREFRWSAGFVSMLANNVPDFDALYTRITVQPLGSLLHHRGHTHTFLLAIPLGLLALPPLFYWARREGWRFSGSERRWLWALALFGGFLHIALDFGNNYGVHPFWPLHGRWFYGDSIFIVEPFLWAALIAPLWFLTQSRLARILLAVVLLTGIALCWIEELVPRSMALAVSLTSAALGLWAWRSSDRARVLVALTATLTVIAGFALAGRRAESAVAALTRHDFPHARTLSLVLTPTPANPFCWNAVVLQTEGETYYARSAVYALAPALLRARDCRFGGDLTTTAPSRHVPAPERPELRYLRQFAAPRAEFKDLHENDCFASAFFRFARAPYWTELFGQRIVGDVRYDRAPDLDFSDVAIERSAPCPRFVPPWVPPRSDLLAP